MEVGGHAPEPLVEPKRLAQVLVEHPGIKPGQSACKAPDNISYLVPHRCFMIVQTCRTCQIQFSVKSSEVARGGGKYCSRSCSSKAPRGEKVHNSTCSYCHATFYRNSSKKQNSKSGLQFCCREHKDLAQQIASGFKEIQPQHYTGTTLYRKTAIQHYGPRCMRCGYSKIVEVLEVHHRDRDHSNSAIENLEVLCPTCHCEQHFLTQSGRFVDQKNKKKMPV